MKSKLKNLTSIMQSRWNNGQSLKSIYDELFVAYSQVYAPEIFAEFCIHNKKNSKFNREFNSTSFV